MPRPKRPNAPEPKRRSRHGCWPCKRKKTKCGEEKPACANCVRQGDLCDYSVRLNWEGRTKRKTVEPSTPSSTSGKTFSANLSQPPPPPPSMATPSPSDWQAPPGSFSNFVQSEWTVGGGSSPHASSPGNPGAVRMTPVSPSSAAPAHSPQTQETAEYPAVSLESPVSSAVVESTLSPQAFPASFSVNDSLQHSQSLQFPDSPDYTSIGTGFTYIPSFGFENNSISQPTSFLRETFPAADIPTQSSQPNQGDLHRVKRHRHNNHELHQNQASPAMANTRPAVIAGMVSMSVEGTLRRHVTLRHLLLQSAGTSSAVEGTSLADRQVIVSGHELNFGFDCGNPDYDLNKNNDSEAIQPITPPEEVFASDEPDSNSPSSASQTTPTGSFRVRRRSSFTTGGGYYVTPVQVKIPRWMAPLPATLLENPVNMMYFHHFIDHTARILVPHDCDENAFLKVLPAMAIADSNLLNLMLAYSASHRARFLRHLEPSNRVAHWVRDVFPTLRHALNEPDEKVTHSHLATAIMLLSLKIVSPSTFEVPITWQMHLKLARDLFVACGVHHQARPENKEAYFLAHWFGYLDIVGSLSCRHSGPPLLQTNYWSASSSVDQQEGSNDNDEYYRVDCFAGFTPRTGGHLARLAYLTYRCDSERFNEVGEFLPHWTPSQEIVEAAESLLADMEHSRLRGHAEGTHHSELENAEMIAIDRAFHWSAVLHVYRRVLAKDRGSAEIRDAANHLYDAITRIRPGSSTECSVLFPLFTAGCEVQDSKQRLEIMTRVMNFEAEGLKQFNNARTLMQRCWEQDLPWIALAQGEFLG